MAAPELQRILVVEDDPHIQLVTRVALEDVGGFEVHGCLTGEDALREAPGFAPDLILLDVLMPGLSGPQTLAELRRLPDLATTPVVFVTAKSRQEEVDRFHDLGADAVITKPFDPLTLSDDLRRIWAGRAGGD